jgi:3',5'-cyclic AMP phosphodiesterase CpdA
MTSTSFSFIHISDHHLFESETKYEYGFSTAYAFRQVFLHIAENVASKADFIVTTGDVAKISSKETYKHVTTLLQAESCLALHPGHLLVSLEGLQNYPLYVLPGNLDDRDNFFRYMLPHVTPKTHMNFAFEHKGIRFICLDWGSKAKAKSSPEMFDFLRNAFQTNVPSIMLMHHHITPVGIPWMDDFIADNVCEFRDLISGQNILGIFNGHTHCTYEAQIEGIPVYGIRSTAPQFVSQAEPLMCLENPHYRLINVADEDITTQIYEVPL